MDGERISLMGVGILVPPLFIMASSESPSKVGVQYRQQAYMLVVWNMHILTH